MFERCSDQFHLWNYFVEWGKYAFMSKDTVSFGTNGRDLPICLDSGALLSISFVRSDFFWHNKTSQ